MSHYISDQYLSSGFQGESIDGGLQRMLGDDSIPTGTHKCSECGKIFQGRAYPNPSNPKNLLCVEHYEKYASKCVGCQQAIFGQYVKTFEGQKYHPQCYSEDYFCDRCKKPVFGEILHAETKYFHPACFTCCKCYSRINDSYTIHKDDIYCEKCAKEISVARSTQSGKIEMILKKKEALDRQKDLDGFRSNVEK